MTPTYAAALAAWKGRRGEGKLRAGPAGDAATPRQQHHQGGLVQTQNGDWYYLSFVDACPRPHGRSSR